MNASDRLLNLPHSLIVGRAVTGKITVHYEYGFTKGCDGVLIGECGRGNTFEEACEDYLNRISGKVLVIDGPYHPTKEIRVL